MGLEIICPIACLFGASSLLLGTYTGICYTAVVGLRSIELLLVSALSTTTGVLLIGVGCLMPF
jgi:hypothetical protein